MFDRFNRHFFTTMRAFDGRTEPRHRGVKCSQRCGDGTKCECGELAQTITRSVEAQSLNPLWLLPVQPELREAPGTAIPFNVE